MPREPRIYIEKVLYLITAKGDEDRNLFNDREDYGAYLQFLAEYKKEYGFKLYAFSLLPKSLYLLIELENNVTISTIMHNLNSRYTKCYNSRYGKKGHLFQSRFKSVLIEKDEYLLRMTRYIHLLPQAAGLTQAVTDYPYSSCAQYVSNKSTANISYMMNEMDEVLSCFSVTGFHQNRPMAYTHYLQSADTHETANIQKLLHRKTFVGSKQFVETIRQKIKDHVQEEKEARVVRRINPGFALAGSLIILFLSFAAYNMYHTQVKLQKTLSTATEGFGAAREELARRVYTLQDEVTGFEQKENHGLGGFAWEVKLTPVQAEYPNGTYTDKLEFKGGQLVSAKLTGQGFTAFDYTIQDQTHGKKVWRTEQTTKDGTTVRWYGIIAGDTMRGVYSEEIPAQGKSRDFSFVSVRRINDAGGVNYVVQ